MQALFVGRVLFFFLFCLIFNGVNAFEHQINSNDSIYL